MQSLLHQENLSQFTITTLTSVYYQFIIKLKFNLKQSQSNNITKVKTPAENQQSLLE